MEQQFFSLEFRDTYFFLTGLFVLHSNVKINTLFPCDQASSIQENNLVGFFCRGDYLQVFLLVLEMYSCGICKITVVQENRYEGVF